MNQNCNQSTIPSSVSSEREKLCDEISIIFGESIKKEVIFSVLQSVDWNANEAVENLLLMTESCKGDPCFDSGTMANAAEDAVKPTLLSTSDVVSESSTTANNEPAETGNSKLLDSANEKEINDQLDLTSKESLSELEKENPTRVSAEDDLLNTAHYFKSLVDGHRNEEMLPSGISADYSQSNLNHYHDLSCESRLSYVIGKSEMIKNVSSDQPSDCDDNLSSLGDVTDGENYAKSNSGSEDNSGVCQSLTNASLIQLSSCEVNRNEMICGAPTDVTKSNIIITPETINDIRKEFRSQMIDFSNKFLGCYQHLNSLGTSEAVVDLQNGVAAQSSTLTIVDRLVNSDRNVLTGDSNNDTSDGPTSEVNHDSHSSTVFFSHELDDVLKTMSRASLSECVSTEGNFAGEASLAASLRTTKQNLASPLSYHLTVSDQAAKILNCDVLTDVRPLKESTGGKSDIDSKVSSDECVVDSLRNIAEDESLREQSFSHSSDEESREKIPVKIFPSLCLESGEESQLAETKGDFELVSAAFYLPNSNIIYGQVAKGLIETRNFVTKNSTPLSLCVNPLPEIFQSSEELKENDALAMDEISSRFTSLQGTFEGSEESESRDQYLSADGISNPILSLIQLADCDEKEGSITDNSYSFEAGQVASCATEETYKFNRDDFTSDDLNVLELNTKTLQTPGGDLASASDFSLKGNFDEANNTDSDLITSSYYNMPLDYAVGLLHYVHNSPSDTKPESLAQAYGDLSAFAEYITFKEKTSNTLGEEIQNSLGDETPNSLGEEIPNSFGEETPNSLGEATLNSLEEGTQNSPEENLIPVYNSESEDEYKVIPDEEDSISASSLCSDSGEDCEIISVESAIEEPLQCSYECRTLMKKCSVENILQCETYQGEYLREGKFTSEGDAEGGLWVDIETSEVNSKYHLQCEICPGELENCGMFMSEGDTERRTRINIDTSDVNAEYDLQCKIYPGELSNDSASMSEGNMEKCAKVNIDTSDVNAEYNLQCDINTNELENGGMFMSEGDKSVNSKVNIDISDFDAEHNPQCEIHPGEIASESTVVSEDTDVEIAKVNIDTGDVNAEYSLRCEIHPQDAGSSEKERQPSCSSVDTPDSKITKTKITAVASTLKLGKLPPEKKTTDREPKPKMLHPTIARNKLALSNIHVGYVSYDSFKKLRNSLELVKLYVNENIKVLCFLRGLPGSGKSSLANRVMESCFPNYTLADFYQHVFSADDYFRANQPDGVYQYDAKKISNAHAWNRENIEMAASVNITPIIVDNTHCELWEMMPVTELALKYGYDIQILEPDSPWAFQACELARRNIHAVNLKQILSMLSRYEPNVTPLTLLANANMRYEPNVLPPQLGIRKLSDEAMLARFTERFKYLINSISGSKSKNKKKLKEQALAAAANLPAQLTAETDANDGAEILTVEVNEDDAFSTEKQNASEVANENLRIMPSELETKFEEPESSVNNDKPKPQRMNRKTRKALERSQKWREGNGKFNAEGSSGDMKRLEENMELAIRNNAPTQKARIFTNSEYNSDIRNECVNNKPNEKSKRKKWQSRNQDRPAPLEIETPASSIRPLPLTAYDKLFLSCSSSDESNDLELTNSIVIRNSQKVKSENARSTLQPVYAKVVELNDSRKTTHEETSNSNVSYELMSIDEISSMPIKSAHIEVTDSKVLYELMNSEKNSSTPVESCSSEVRNSVSNEPTNYKENSGAPMESAGSEVTSSSTLYELMNFEEADSNNSRDTLGFAIENANIPSGITSGSSLSYDVMNLDTTRDGSLEFADFVAPNSNAMSHSASSSVGYFQNSENKDNPFAPHQYKQYSLFSPSPSTSSKDYSLFGPESNVICGNYGPFDNREFKFRAPDRESYKFSAVPNTSVESAALNNNNSTPGTSARSDLFADSDPNYPFFERDAPITSDCSEDAFAFARIQNDLYSQNGESSLSENKKTEVSYVLNNAMEIGETSRGRVLTERINNDLEASSSLRSTCARAIENNAADNARASATDHNMENLATNNESRILNDLSKPTSVKIKQTNTENNNFIVLSNDLFANNADFSRTFEQTLASISKISNESIASTRVNSPNVTQLRNRLREEYSSLLELEEYNITNVEGRSSSTVIRNKTKELINARRQGEGTDAAGRNPSTTTITNKRKLTNDRAGCSSATSVIKDVANSVGAQTSANCSFATSVTNDVNSRTEVAATPVDITTLVLQGLGPLDAFSHLENSDSSSVVRISKTANKVDTKSVIGSPASASSSYNSLPCSSSSQSDLPYDDLPGESNSFANGSSVAENDICDEDSRDEKVYVDMSSMVEQLVKRFGNPTGFNLSDYEPIADLPVSLARQLHSLLIQSIEVQAELESNSFRERNSAPSDT